MRRVKTLQNLLPGLALAVAIALVAAGIEQLEIGLLGHPLLDGLVAAILLGVLVRSVLGRREGCGPGIAFAAKPVLEIAIVCLGGTISATSLLTSGLPLIAAIVGVVLAALLLSYGIGRALGLDDRLATLVACGNSICGNSAIMAAAPAIGAPPAEIAAAIGFTAVLGVLVVVLLPALAPLLGLGQWQYGIVAGLSVYAVPQVLAAAAPVGTLATQVGTLVKLVRVLMLGPVVLAIGLLRGRTAGKHLPLALLVPWFILGFVALMALRSLGLIPDDAAAALQVASVALTLVAMAGLGLSVDLRQVLAAGGRVLAAGALSITLLIGLAVLAATLLPAG